MEQIFSNDTQEILNQLKASQEAVDAQDELASRKSKLKKQAFEDPYFAIEKSWYEEFGTEFVEELASIAIETRSRATFLSKLLHDDDSPGFQIGIFPGTVSR